MKRSTVQIQQAEDHFRRVHEARYVPDGEDTAPDHGAALPHPEAEVPWPEYHAEIIGVDDSLSAVLEKLGCHGIRRAFPGGNSRLNCVWQWVDCTFPHGHRSSSLTKSCDLRDGT
jgi:hypothetical protein